MFDFLPADMKRARIDAGFDNLRDAAEAVGVSYVMLSQIESGRKAGTIKTMSKLCRAYGIKLVIDANTAEAWN